jgi:hypothetical protein
LEGEIKGWEAYLEEKDDNKVIDAIRKSSLTGRPCGDDGFMRRIEGILNRELRAKRWGRPSKGK